VISSNYQPMMHRLATNVTNQPTPNQPTTSRHGLSHNEPLAV